MSARYLGTIWISPRRTIRQIVATGPGLNVVLFACLTGVGQFLDRATMRDLGDRMPLSMILGLAVTIGPLAGLVSLEILSRVVRWTGRWLGGFGELPAIKAALAWAMVPTIFALPLWVPQLALFGLEMFQTEMPTLEARPGRLVALLAFGFVEVSCAVWSVVLASHTVAEVQGYRSAWRGLWNLVIFALLIGVPLIALAVALAWFGRQGGV